MIAIWAGLAAAVLFAVGTLAGTAATKQIGSVVFTAWMMLAGFIVIVPALLIDGAALPDRESVYLMGYVGAATLVGLLIMYSALREGSVSVVIPIVSAEGAVTAVIAWIAGDVPSPVKLFGMLVVIGSVVALVALSVDPAADPSVGRRVSDRRSAALAVVVCLLMGSMLFAQGRLGQQVSLAWAVLPARALTVAVLALPLALKGQLRISRLNLKLVVLSGLADIAGIAVFVVGSRHDLAVTTVLATQYSVVAILLAAWLFNERLRISQRWVVAALVCGIAMVAWAST